MYDENKSKYQRKTGFALGQRLLWFYMDYGQRESPLDLKCALCVCVTRETTPQTNSNESPLLLFATESSFIWRIQIYSSISCCFASIHFVVLQGNFVLRPVPFKADFVDDFCRFSLYACLLCIIIDAKCFSFTARARACVS